ncbi:MAG: tRNA pseudouridine(38-40) synthase TruA, partial [Spirochaetaceae bacterium]|nr:tRNA pseudouridine(38-40) synthase TruA [Spirochaetaceae bacterium]
YVQDGNLVFEIKANAFLWKMVRSLVGSLIEYEKKGFTADDFNRILLSKDRSLAGVTAPPTGLFLWSVGFDGKRVH